jgi:hypothetical protein
LFVPVHIGRPLGVVPSWDRFAALDGSSRAELDALEADLENGVGSAADDPAWNADAWRRVSALLDRLPAGR